MAFPVRAVVRRHMARTGRFYDGAPADLPLKVLPWKQENVIGWYRNPSPWEPCVVVFTESAIYSIEDKDVVRIEVNDILGYEFPKSKQNVSGVRVQTSKGDVFVRIAGTRGPDGGIKDAFDFIMVIKKIAGNNLRSAR
ncbi:hypothetical protein [Anaeromyxobacter oryzisoli]|uniref:hypothetical protein n=1 Tax=Anaeromyxobacter oryzisoli TaxID=2925408 RepID=UPI001F573892|nr:hypothetical protein [Anaeromyxobacter sp. SG63]